MNKEDLIAALNAIPGNPPVFIKRDGATYKVDEPIETALFEKDLCGEICTFSPDRKDVEGSDCIVLWAEPITEKEVRQL